MRHVVMMSGGIGSWATARRVADQHGTDNLVLLFADTLAEDPDLYRFLDDAAHDIGVPITRVADGRTPQQVFFDVRLLGNSRIAPCSRPASNPPAPGPPGHRPCPPPRGLWPGFRFLSCPTDRRKPRCGYASDRWREM